MNDFLFQCVSKKTMNVAISQNEEFNNRLKKHLLDMNDIEIEYRDNAPIFSLTPFVPVIAAIFPFAKCDANSISPHTGLFFT